tara:strand:+ start:198 stop:362 length:165 start_codon:yes stop_codon:yes gene_type:complete
MENRYFVKLKLFTNIPEVADHNKTMSFMIEANSQEEVEQIIDINHEIIEIVLVD